VLSRLQKRWPEVLPVHRLDQDTSGLLLFARDANAQGALQRQFQERRVRKVYQALLSSLPDPPQGRLDLALAPDPDHPGCYRIEPGGKSALTYYRILDAETARVELRPLSGRSHQLRVHMAQGLHCPIRGDRLYGAAGERPDRAAGERLMLHASELAIAHPEDGRRRTFSSPGP
jgi:tRNA pseudouridine32 synthase/23S rRNA pseudouridine746 synthase